MGRRTGDVLQAGTSPIKGLKILSHDDSDMGGRSVRERGKNIEGDGWQSKPN